MPPPDPTEHVAQVGGEAYFTEALAHQVAGAATDIAEGDLASAEIVLTGALDLIRKFRQDEAECVSLLAFREAAEIAIPKNEEWDTTRYVYSGLLDELASIRASDSWDYARRDYDVGKIEDIVALIEERTSDQSEREKLMILSIFRPAPGFNSENAYNGFDKTMNHISDLRMKALALTFTPGLSVIQKDGTYEGGRHTVAKELYGQLSIEDQTRFLVDYMTLANENFEESYNSRYWYEINKFVQTKLPSFTKDINAVFARCGREVFDRNVVNKLFAYGGRTREFSEKAKGSPAK